MGDSFYRQIEKMDESDWNYYFGGLDNLALPKPFVTANPAKAFISDYFRKGGKEKITEAFELDKFQVERADHTVAVFFLGALLLKNTAFGRHKFFDPKVEKWYEFTLFMWFVTCLAHDAAYTLEHEKRIFSDAATVEGLYKEHQIESKLMEQRISGVPEDILACVKPYFRYRLAQGVTDHGIYAGVLGFDVLVKNRKEKRKEVGIESLYWGDDLDRFYAVAAATIATHNIWLPGDAATIDKYRQAGLEKLIGRMPITFSEGPLLYFLGLIDTIDPVKAYGKKGISVLEVLANIHIAYSPTTFTLIVSGGLDPSILHDQAKYAKDWLAIEYSKLEKGVDIHFYLD